MTERLKITKAFNWRPKKEIALSNALEKNSEYTNDNIVLFSRDIDTLGHRQFAVVAIEEIDKLHDVLQENNHLYENLLPNLPVKPYFDLEIEKLDGITKSECKELLDLFLNWLIPSLNAKYDIQLNKDDFLILDSCRHTKL